MLPVEIDRAALPPHGEVVIKGRKYIVTYNHGNTVILRPADRQECFCVYKCAGNTCEVYDCNC